MQIRPSESFFAKWKKSCSSAAPFPSSMNVLEKEKFCETVIFVRKKRGKDHE